MAVIKPEAFLQQLQADPQQSVKVIIRTNENPQIHTTNVEALGLTVTGTTSLIRSISATGPASAVMRLSSEAWVDSIEPDQAVQATG